MPAKRAFILLWLVFVALFVWAGFEPRYSLDDQHLPYPYLGIALLSLLTLGETALIYRGVPRLPRPLALRVLLLLLGLAVLMLYSSLTTLHMPLIAAAHALWLVLLIVMAGWYLLRRK